MPPRAARAETRRIDAPGRVVASTPYRILSGIILVCAAVSLLLAIFPGAGSRLRTLDFLVSGVLLVLGLAAVLAAPRVPHEWGLDGLIVFVILIACAGAALVPTGEAQVIAGLGLSLFTVFAAYFRPRRRFLGLLTLGVVGYMMAALANPVMSNAAAVVAVLAVVIGLSLMVNVQSVRLHELVLLDPLTGVLNRRGLEAHAQQIAASAARLRTPLTVGLIDLDDFKAYNDRYGHAAGDELLIDTARAWRSAARASDLVARYGGDEFAVVMVGMGPEDAALLAERVQSQNARSWSVGFSTWAPDEDIYAALARADVAMFIDKADGEPSI